MEESIAGDGCHALRMVVPARRIVLLALTGWLLLAYSATAHASLQLILHALGPDEWATIDDNGPFDVDSAWDSIRVGGPGATPLVVGGFEFSGWGRSYSVDHVQYVALSDALISGTGTAFFLELWNRYELPGVMHGYASHASDVRFVEPMVPANHAAVESYGELHHNDVDIHFVNHVRRATIDGIPGSETLVLHPDAEEEYWFRTLLPGRPEYELFTHMLFDELPAGVPTHLELHSEMKVRFDPWIPPVPEPASGMVWCAWVPMVLSRRRELESTRTCSMPTSMPTGEKVKR